MSVRVGKILEKERFTIGTFSKNSYTYLELRYEKLARFRKYEVICTFFLNLYNFCLFILQNLSANSTLMLDMFLLTYRVKLTYKVAWNIASIYRVRKLLHVHSRFIERSFVQKKNTTQSRMSLKKIKFPSKIKNLVYLLIRDHIVVIFSAFLPMFSKTSETRLNDADRRL